jgi:hypothetical protein
VLTSNASLVQQQILFVVDVEYPGLQVAHVADVTVDVSINWRVKHCVVIPGRPDKSHGHPSHGFVQ